MIKTLTTAATGLQAQQKNIERISNDLANANTDGYKRGRVEFEDLMYETTREPGGALGETTQSPVGVQSGMGVKVAGEHKIFEQGPTRMTYRPFDLVIEGKGFFGAQLPSGEIAYTRTGSFKKDEQGTLRLTNGAQLVPQITIPSNAVKVSISGQGEVIAQFQNGTEATIGQMQIVSFQNEQGLNSLGGGMYLPSRASGQPVQGLPGENGLGSLQQGGLEGSNVNVASSMVDMITTQRAYEMNTKVMSTADQMLEATVRLK